MIQNILVGKSIEEIKKALTTDKNFKNKAFLQMVTLIYPDKLDQVLNILSLVNTRDIYDDVIALFRGYQVGHFKGLTILNAELFLIKLCGIPEKRIEISIHKDHESFYLTLNKTILMG